MRSIVLCCLVLAASGCVSMWTAPLPPPPRAAVDVDCVNQHCRVVMQSRDKNTRTAYEGKLISYNDDSIVLENPVAESHMRRHHPVFGPLFTTGITSRYSHDSELTLNRYEIATIEMKSCPEARTTGTTESDSLVDAEWQSLEPPIEHDKKVAER